MASVSAFRSFPRPFWVINGIELLERGAYYVMNYSLAVFLASSLGLPPAQQGALFSILFLLLYVIPLLGAPFAEKYGYKAALLASFALLLAGYSSLFLAAEFGGALLAVTLIGFGAGVFKPIAAAVVAQTSSTEQRNTAFVIYYGAINLGATVIPLAVGLLGVLGGLAPERLVVPAFATAAILSALNLALIATTWRNLRAPQRETSVFRAMASLGEIVRYPKLVLLFVIYSGFWFLYAMSLSFLPTYMLDFDRMPEWFNQSLLGTVNPLAIVIVAPLLGALAKRFQSLSLMIAGISLYVVGFVVLGFSDTSLLFTAGILIFSIGEILTHPAFLSYVSKIAPPDKVSVFLGYGFLPIAVGLFFGANVGGVLYGRFAVDAGTPATFWAIMSAVALVAVAALLLYNRFVAPPAAAPMAPTGFMSGPAPTMGLAALALLLVPALVVGATYIPGGTPLAASNDEGGIDASNLATLVLPEETGRANEGETIIVPIALPANATGRATFTLTWQDEAPATPAGTNAPDTFRLRVIRADGTAIESEPNQSGTLELVLDDATPGDYTVEITLDDAGDMSSLPGTPLGPLPGASSPDTGNDFALVVSHQAAA